MSIVDRDLSLEIKRKSGGRCFVVVTTVGGVGGDSNYCDSIAVVQLVFQRITFSSILILTCQGNSIISK